MFFKPIGTFVFIEPKNPSVNQINISKLIVIQLLDAFDDNSMKYNKFSNFKE